jgi:hypothetical protein
MAMSKARPTSRKSRPRERDRSAAGPAEGATNFGRKATKKRITLGLARLLSIDRR